MATYRYVIKKEGEKPQAGTVTAPSREDALDKLKALGGTVTKLEEEQGKISGAPKGGYKLKLKERIIFTEQLSVMLNAGVTLVNALKSLRDETDSKQLRGVLSLVVTDVEGGLPFSEALAKHPKCFSYVYAQMVKSSERTGNMADILKKLSIQQQKEYDLKGKVRGALMYPAVISVLMVSVIILVITFILPRLVGLFSGAGVKLPATTRFLLALSDIFITKWWLLILIGGGAVYGYKAWVKTARGRAIADRLKLRFPVLGSFIRKAILARFTQTFASLMEAGVPVLDAFATSKGVVSNSLYETEIEKISKDVANGTRISVAIRKSPAFPGMVGQLVAVGEQSGDLAGIFGVLSNFFEKEVDGMAKNLSTLLEPLVMIVMGGAIGFILISVLQPILQLSNAV